MIPIRYKNTIKIIFSILFLVFLCLNLKAQINSNLKQKHLKLSEKTIKLDTLSIIPGTLSVFIGDSLISRNFYSLKYLSSEIEFSDIVFQENKNAVLLINYRCFSNNLGQKYYHKETNLITTPLSNHKKKYSNTNNNNNFFNNSELYKEGVISRGVSIGNNQDAVINSNFNLNLAGKLNKDYQIKASVSENNIPLQAEGTTRQLQEFDKMYIRVYSDKNSLTVGDFELTKPKGFFLNLNKNVKGALFENTFKNKKITVKNKLSAAIAKGAYNRIKIQGQENNQGPYKLYGAYNESFIIILSGSERVLINGKQLTRGKRFDYTIDYNKAELSFTPKTQITKDSRIIVEFEYSEKNYVRFNTFSENEIKTKKIRFGFNYYAETDSKTQTINQELNDEEKQLLSEIGNNLNRAFVPSIDTFEFDNDLILYRLIDTTINSVLYTNVLVHSNNPQNANYKPSFSYVGENKGNYIKVNSLANGKVFKWLAPENNIPQGNYEPIKQLITPKKKEIFNFWLTKDLTKKLSSDFEIAFSNNDLNTYSYLENSDNKGFAVKLLLSYPSDKFLAKLKTTDSIAAVDSVFNKNYKRPKNIIFSRLNYQFIHTNFSVIQRYRESEFERNWNLSDTLAGNENFLNWQIAYKKSDSAFVNYKFSFLEKGSKYKAIKNSIRSLKLSQKFSFELQTDYLNTFSGTYNSNFLVNYILLERKFKKFNAGFSNNSEYNLWVTKLSKELLNNSYFFRESDIFITNKTNKKKNWQLTYRLRSDYLPYNNELKESTLAQNLNFDLNLTENKNNQIKLSAFLRKLEIQDTILSTLEPQNSANLQVEHNLSLFKRSITTRLLYQNFSGLELKRDFSYLEVPYGQGNYQWNDYNQNKIKELDEFELSVYSAEANYMKILQPSNEYEKVYGNKFSFSANVNPRRVWNKKTGFKKILSRFSERFAYTAQQKTIDFELLPHLFTENGLNYYRSLSLNAKNTFSFNKSKRLFGADYIFINSTNVLLNTNGTDISENKNHKLLLKWLLFNSLKIENTSSSGQKNFSSEFMSSRNYSIEQQANKTMLNFQYNRSLKFTFDYTYTLKNNKIGDEKSSEHKGGLNFTYSKLRQSNLQLRFEYVNINFKGETQNSVAFNMLQGLQTGNNYVWNLTYMKQISKLLQLNLNYSGRSGNQSSLIHNGNIQLRAVF